MRINSTPEESSEALTSSAATADRLRRTEMDKLAQAMETERTSLETERRRLAAKYGADGPQSQGMARRLEVLDATRRSVKIERARQRVGALETDPEAFAVYGRVLSEAGDGLTRISVAAVDVSGADLIRTQTDEAGMFQMRVPVRQKPDASRPVAGAPSPAGGPSTFQLRIVDKKKGLSITGEEVFELIGDRAAYREIMAPGTASPAPTATGATPSRRGDPAPGRRRGGGGTRDGSYPSGVKYRGLNRAGAEYGDDWNGWTGQTFYTVPSAADLADELTFLGEKGFNIIRLPISWERLQHELLGDLDEPYKEKVVSFVNQANAAGWPVIIDLHNYNRYASGAFDAAGEQVDGYTQHVLGDGTLLTSHLVDVWQKIVALFPASSKVIFNIMNEPHDFPMTSDVWFSNIQTIIDAIRATGANQLILVPNSRGSDVDHWDTWSPNGGPLDSVAALAITDSANNYAFDMHAYQDPPSSPTSYVDLVTPVTEWATMHGKKLFLSEFGVENADPNGASALGNLFAYLNDHSDVWIGWTAWNLSPWNITAAGDYTADGPQMPWYEPYLTANTVGGR